MSLSPVSGEEGHVTGGQAVVTGIGVSKAMQTGELALTASPGIAGGSSELRQEQTYRV